MEKLAATWPPTLQSITANQVQVSNQRNRTIRKLGKKFWVNWVNSLIKRVWKGQDNLVFNATCCFPLIRTVPRLMPNPEKNALKPCPGSRRHEFNRIPLRMMRLARDPAYCQPHYT